MPILLPFCGWVNGNPQNIFHVVLSITLLTQWEQFKSFGLSGSSVGSVICIGVRVIVFIGLRVKFKKELESKLTLSESIVKLIL